MPKPLQHLVQPSSQALAWVPRSARMAIVALVLLAPVGAEAAQHLYRFHNADGGIEISHTIPSERVAFGYEVIDSHTGRVLEVVEPQKSKAEVERINRETKARDACKVALARVNSLYRSEVDIQAAEDQTIKSLEGRIANAQLNLRQVLDQQRDFEATAAQLERSGKSLDATLVENIAKAQAQAGNLEQEIEQRHREQEDARLRFARDLALFKQASCSTEDALSFIRREVAGTDSGES